MDLLTQLDSSLDLLLSIMSSSIAYISRKAKHSPLPASTIPLTILGKTEAIEADEMDAAIAELVEDLVAKADQIRAIIEHLPTEQSLGGDDCCSANWPGWRARCARRMASIGARRRRCSG